MSMRRNSKITTLAVYVFLASTCGDALAQAPQEMLGYPKYEIISIGLSKANDINANGEVVGSLGSLAAMWLPVADGGRPDGLNMLPGLCEVPCGSEALGINSEGVVVGRADSPVVNPVTGARIQHAVVWIGDTVFDLGAAAGSACCEDVPFSHAYRINNSRQIVGISGVFRWGYIFIPRPAIWLLDAGFGLEAGVHLLGRNPGQSGSGFDINALGQVIGAIDSYDFVPSGKAFIWLPEPAYGLPLGLTEIGGVGSRAIAINDSGMIAGETSTLYCSELWVWNAATKDTVVLERPAGPCGTLADLNNSGTVVGWTGIGATMWREESLIYLEERVQDLGDWHRLFTANAINERGQIVGSGFNGDYEAFLLNPLGACCDPVAGICTNEVPSSRCVGGSAVWWEGRTCDGLPQACHAVPGACCDPDAFGSCTETTWMACDCPTCVWHKLQTCNDIECSHGAIPTVSEWGLVVLTLLLLTGAKIYSGWRWSEAT